MTEFNYAKNLREKFPHIPWDTPLKVNLIGFDPNEDLETERGFFCRYCVAEKGLKGSEVAGGGQTFKEVRAHIESEHSEGEECDS